VFSLADDVDGPNPSKANRFGSADDACDWQYCRGRTGIEAQSDLKSQLEEAFDRELLEVAMRRIKGRTKAATWEAFHLTAIEGLSGALAAQKLGMPMGHVFVAKHRVQKLFQDEVRILKNEPN
jgi:DNA-directed RNA polymerase specialized sigma24 family protein